ncbi:hypothetical protein ThidrDRAFT_4611 [Thiorhodococcus drewsii AZ1]|uniref:Helix-turn-helix domain protein n=1 Tax=Thiorhodococcus drewsii AZ1 TaxID=765913 RepID=G2E8J7_9GAMM|nr:helix-turn-helix domain-containing protein [Thiorhodococcus drewsii]EGV27575.1 hypothetical protein ThidrDRAFT_4611 [Thiorhodococcus drewsii AZ1]
MAPPRFDTLQPDINDLIEARHAAGLDQAEAAKVCGISLRRWRDIEKGRAKLPLSIYRLMVALGGWIPDAAWYGWRISKGELWSPENFPYRPSDLYALHWYRQIIQELRVKRRDRQVQAEAPTSKVEENAQAERETARRSGT